MTKRLLLLMLCVPVLAFGVSACGGDDDDTGDSASTAMENTTDTGMEAEAPGTIVDLAMDNPDLSTLTEAVVAADLTETLQGEGPFTVFAPTNEAFEALPPAELKRLLKPANKAELADILTYHVVPGAVMSSDLKDGQKPETVQGGTVEVSVDGSDVKVNDATVTQADIEASNGVVHVVDTVLVPKQ
ncbi:MAG: fasciclin domain-containing protein [Solirubrobacterales bacterium]